MPKTPAPKEIVEDVAPEAPALRELTIDDVQAIARAATNVNGYLVGSAYRGDFDDGVLTLNNYGLNFVEPVPQAA